MGNPSDTALLPDAHQEDRETLRTMLREIIANPLQLESDGTICVPQGPGLGIEIDEKAVAKYRIH